MRNYTFLAGSIARAKKGQVSREPWRPSPPAAEPKDAALRCFGDIRLETMKREGLMGSAKGTRTARRRCCSGVSKCLGGISGLSTGRDKHSGERKQAREGEDDKGHADQHKSGPPPQHKTAEFSLDHPILSQYVVGRRSGLSLQLIDYPRATIVCFALRSNCWRVAHDFLFPGIPQRCSG
jgi:hypothetical protein